ncbi:MAG: GldG family protein [Planctomycetes bacterium]|nr:GldG family protein [Planctomycetota bacterium]
MKKLLSLGGLALVLVLFLVVNVLFNALFTSTRFDLTENKLYTLSSGAKNVVSKLNDPVKLKFYFSRKLLAESDAAPLIGYGDRVRELLEEFVASSNGKLTLEVFDPEPFSEEEDRAVGFGLSGAPVTAGGEKAYFGLAATGTTDMEEVIPFFDQRKEESLEYDITRLVYNISNPKKKVVGLITKLPLEGDPMARMRNPRAAPEEWAILEQIRAQFDVRTLADGVTAIDKDVDVLLVVHPQQLVPETLYAIDQYVLGGGKAVVFADPHCEVQQVQRDPNNPLQDMMADRSSSLGALFDAWGIEMKADEIAGDRDNALRVNYGGQGVEYLVWLGFNKDKGALSTTDFTTNQLGLVRMATAGILSKKDGGTTSITPLIETSKASQRIQKSQIQFGPNPPGLLQSFKSGDEKLMLAARVSGPAKTAFPDGSPKAKEPPVDGATKPEEPATIQESKEINVIVVADADLLSNNFWADIKDFLGIQKIMIKTADNCDFLLNALDNLSGSNDLISLRSRGKYQRPFDKVVQIRKDAEVKFRQREKELEDKLRDTETKISELQRGKEGEGAIVLNEEQIAELEKFREEQVKTRQDLRRVKHDLLQDVESLGRTVTLANLAIMPLLILGFALAFLLRKKQSS